MRVVYGDVTDRKMLCNHVYLDDFSFDVEILHK